MVVCCAVITPILLKLVFKPRAGEDEYHDLAESALADRYDNAEQLDILSDQLLEANRKLQSKDKK